MLFLCMLMWNIWKLGISCYSRLITYTVNEIIMSELRDWRVTPSDERKCILCWTRQILELYIQHGKYIALYTHSRLLFIAIDMTIEY